MWHQGLECVQLEPLKWPWRLLWHKLHWLPTCRSSNFSSAHCCTARKSASPRLYYIVVVWRSDLMISTLPWKSKCKKHIIIVTIFWFDNQMNKTFLVQATTKVEVLIEFYSQNKDLFTFHFFEINIQGCFRISEMAVENWSCRFSSCLLLLLLLRLLLFAKCIR